MLSNSCSNNIILSPLSPAMSSQPVRARASRFREATMNSTKSIHPPPEMDLYWMELGIEDLIKTCNENTGYTGNAKDVVKELNGSNAKLVRADVNKHPASSQHNDGIFGRVSRAATSLWRNATLSTLGKRKAGDKDVVDTSGRKAEAERAYADAKARGLLPTPQVFKRPRVQAHSTANSPSATPLPPSTPNGRAKQIKLSKRVSNLEEKLAIAKRELSEAIGETPHFFSPDELSPHIHIQEASPKQGKITKKRKAIDEEGKEPPSESESDFERTSKKSKSTVNTRLSKRKSRLLRKRSNVTREEVVIVVPDGVTVPPIPSVPSGIEGKRATLRIKRQKSMRRLKRFFGIGAYH